MTRVGEVDETLLLATAGLLLLAAFFDLLDGALARMMRAESEFGGFFDSIADAVTFGVAPSVIVLKSLSVEPKTTLSFLITGAALIYSISGVLRLCRFSVQHLQEKEDPNLALERKKNFVGLPIPAAASAIVSLNLLIASTPSLFPLSWHPLILASALFFCGYLMVSRLRFPSFKALHFRVRNFQIVLFVVFISVFLFYGLLNHFPWVFAGLSLGYILLSLVLSLTRFITGRRIKQLEDFDPLPDDEEFGV